jgi:hypothetical protein
MTKTQRSYTDKTVAPPKAKNPVRFRIENQDGRLFRAGTGLDSWFTLEKARELCDYNKGQRIVESDGVNILWEIL